MQDIQLNLEERVTVPFITAVRNAVYNADGGIDCEIQFQGGVDSDGITSLFLPYTSSATDSAEYGPQLYVDLVAGKYGEIVPYIVTPELIQFVRDRKHDEIIRWRDAQENDDYVFFWGDRNWDYGKATQNRISIALTIAKKGGLPEGFAWTDADNNIVPMTNESLILLAAAIEDAMFKKGMDINARQLKMKTDIRSLNDISALNDYVIGWG
ncbi:DUF4376 domain-containing protein [Salmonella enterica]|nr:DUF4376 domain-containing protein [Salmonella enterica]ELX2839966.1 DUF4376 domain-containing protein [Salmonella enterica]